MKKIPKNKNNQSFQSGAYNICANANKAVTSLWQPDNTD